MNDAIAAAVSAATTQYPFRAQAVAAPQVITAGSGDVTLVFDNEDFDPQNVFSDNKFACPKDGYYSFRTEIYVGLDSGSPTDIDRQLKLAINGVPFAQTSQQVSNDSGGLSMVLVGSAQLSTGDLVTVSFRAESGGASGWKIFNNKPA